MHLLKITLAIICGTAALLPHSVRAAESNFLEMTMYGGYAFGGDFENNKNRRSIQIEPSNAFGVTIDMEATQDTDEFKKAYYELTYRKQSTELDPALFDMTVENLHVGGRVDFFSKNARVLPYFSVTFGATQFTPSVSTLKDVTKFSIGVGGGIKVPLVKHVALRFDVHAYTTFINSDVDAFCRRPTDDDTSTDDDASTDDDTSDENKCATRWSSSLLVQGEASIGVTIGF